jgi:hypothetical protein
MNKINEKISWSNLLLALGIGYLSVAKWKDYKTIKGIYDVVNSSSSIPNKKESEYIEKIRSEVISKVKESNLFKKFNKQYIIDSLSTIQFKVVDSTIVFSKDAKASYVYIKPLKGRYKYLLSNVPEGENFIIINIKDMNNSDYSSTIVHEIYHYFDRLITNDDERYSEVVDISKYVDNNVSNERYTKKKIMLLMLFSNTSGEIENQIVDGIYDNYISNKKYYNSNSELFARYKSLKHDMLNSDIIQSINQTPTIENLAEYLFSINGLKRLEHLYVLLSLDITKLKELDNLL